MLAWILRSLSCDMVSDSQVNDSISYAKKGSLQVSSQNNTSRLQSGRLLPGSQTSLLPPGNLVFQLLLHTVKPVPSIVPRRPSFAALRFPPQICSHKTPWSLHDGALTRPTSSEFYSDPSTTTSSILISTSGGDIPQSTTNGKGMDIRVLVDDSGVHLVYRMISWVKLRKYREMVRRVRRGLI